MPTYQCNASCKHCGTLSGPNVNVSLTSEQIRESINQASASDYKVVVFTGGEPSLIGREIFSHIKLAKNLDMKVRMVTNARWASTLAEAEIYVQELCDAGLDEINYSTGDQHLRFVPIDFVINAVEAAMGHNIAIAIMIELVAAANFSKAQFEQNERVKHLLETHGDLDLLVRESPWMPLSPNRVGSYPPGLLANKENLARYTGCDSVLSTTTVHSDGRISACCGLGARTIPELFIGAIGDQKISDLDKAADNDFLKRWLRLEGPEHILSWAADHDSSIEWENMYAHKCQACARIYRDEKVRQVIRAFHEEKLIDIVVGEWAIFGCQGSRSTEVSPHNIVV